MAVPGAVHDLARIHGEHIRYEVDNTPIEAYVARPQEEGRYPGVIVIHEAFGPVEHIRDVARRFANQGYIAIAPNLYSRVGSPDLTQMNTVWEKMFSLPDHQIVRDLEGAAEYLRRSNFCTGKVGIIGFCSGGRQTLLTACQSGSVDAAVDCWGGFITSASPDEKTTAARPTPIVDMAGSLHCPLLVVIGEEDTNPSPEEGGLLAEKLADADQPYEVKVYHGAGHAFFADYRPNYREEAAFRLWDDVTEFFQQHLQ
jgi:carboxymethylenebutenolidase